VTEGDGKRKDVPEMLGEFCREAAVLVLVFATLDRVIRSGGLTFWPLAAIIGVSGLFLAVGIAFEKWREP
jgi:hypothetical protein